MRKMQRIIWTAGISGVVIDDDGEPFKDLFNAKQSWNLLPFPTKASLEGFVDKGWSVEGAFTYSKYKAGKTINSDIIKTGGSFIAFDVNAKYDLNEVIGDTKAFSPYGIAGVGYTYRAVMDKKHCPTLNIGVGFNVWFYRGFGINVQSMAKFKFIPGTSNYLMHSVGLVYRFNLLTGYKTPGRLGHRYNLFRN